MENCDYWPPNCRSTKKINFSPAELAHFVINVLIEDGEGYTELPFEPKADLKFLGFLVKRID